MTHKWQNEDVATLDDLSFVEVYYCESRYINDNLLWISTCKFLENHWNKFTFSVM